MRRSTESATAAVTIGTDGRSQADPTKLAASPQLFESEFLNFFSRVHPAIPAIVFVPVIVVMEWLGVDRGLAAWELALLTSAASRSGR